MAFSYSWLGAPLALDLANTVIVVRPGEDLDGLATEAELARWLELERGRLGTASLELREVHRLRAAVRALIHAAACGRELPADAVETVNRAAAAAPAFPQLREAGVVVESKARSRGDEVLGAIAASAVELLGGPDRERIRNCRAPRCGLYFLAGRERQVWCCSACGNRARVARHAQRAASTARPPFPAA